MKGPKIITRLNPKTSSWDSTPASTALESDRITQADISAALAGLPDAPYWLGRAKWLGDLSNRHQLALNVRDEAVRIMGRPDKNGNIVRWKITRPGLLTLMGEIAITEVIYPNNCKVCEGRGAAWNKHGLIKICPECEGSGQGSWSNNAKAKILGMPRQTYDTTWKKRYDLVYNYVRGLDGRIIRHVNRRLT